MQAGPSWVRQFPGAHTPLPAKLKKGIRSRRFSVCVHRGAWGSADGESDPRVNPGSPKKPVGEAGAVVRPTGSGSPGCREGTAPSTPPGHRSRQGKGGIRTVSEGAEGVLQGKGQRSRSRQEPGRCGPREGLGQVRASGPDSRQKPPLGSPGRKGNGPGAESWGPRREAGSPATQSRPPAAIQNPAPGTATPREARNPDFSGKAGRVGRQPCSLPVSIIL